jgi:hypothetical protein
LVTPAQAGCDPGDIFDAAKQTYSAVSDCKSACSNEASCAGAIWLAAVLSGIATEGGQNKVDSFCNQAQGSASQILGKLETIGGSSIGQEVLGQVASLLNSVGSAAMVVKCACETEHAGASLDSSFGSCMEDALCWLQEQLGGGSCYCTRPPPAIARCAAIAEQCRQVTYMEWWRYPECQNIAAPNSIINTNPDGKNSGYMDDWRSTLSISTSSEGTLIEQLPPTAEGTGCGGVRYCYCPAPMKPDWVLIPNPGSGQNLYVFACECPDKTHPGAVMPNGISSCLCDNTNQPANFGFAPFGMCPPPACPAGQTRLGGDDNSPCVTPCADKSQSMAFDGSCCNPAQMTNCGQCCPPDTVPNVKTGSCEPRPKPPK